MQARIRIWNQLFRPRPTAKPITFFGLRRRQFSDDAPTSELYSVLRKRAALGLTESVNTLVDFLVKERCEKPNVRLYAAQILVNVNSEEGSAARVAQILHEMSIEKIDVDTAICHDALKVCLLSHTKSTNKYADSPSYRHSLYILILFYGAIC